MGFLRRIVKVVLIGQGKRIARMIIQEQVRRLSYRTIAALEQALSVAYFVTLQTPTQNDDKIVLDIIDFLGLKLVPVDE